MSSNVLFQSDARLMNCPLPLSTIHQAESWLSFEKHLCFHTSSLTYPSYLSTGPASLGGELQLKLAEVGLGWPTSVKCSCSASGGAAKVWNEADVLVVTPATLAVTSQ